MSQKDFSPADKLNRQGVELYLKGDINGAKLHYLAALKSDATFLPPLSNLIPILSQQNDLPTALSLTRKLLNVDPHNGGLWSNAGNLLTRLDKFDEAKTALEWAIQYSPDERNVWHNLALLYHRMDENDKALECIRQVKDMGGEGKEVLNDEVHMLLAKGDLKNALPAYECRWHMLQHLPPWDFHIKEWKGENLKGKRVLLHHEQGFGDTIMTARFARNLSGLGANVTLGLPQSLCDLFACQDWCDGVQAIENMTAETTNAYDYHSPLYSAMRHLQVEKSSISPLPYLTAPKISVPQVPTNQFNVGICWASGKRNNELDWRRRITPLNLWFPLAEVPDVQLWSLYKRLDHDDQDPHEEISKALIHDHMPRFKSWAETAAFVQKLDLVVTIDTAIGHLSAAMGKPTIMLSQFQHCWRWWDLKNGSGRPWYSCMEIIPQFEAGNWKAQLDLAKIAISRMARNKLMDIAA